ncbi:hypothetical protein PVL29_002028 [Vitis rotundifolia]|uniref:Phosphatidic acid phosphatase type 2/haloperoxidase domain-containing protein n=1 Tax=Vitis rotundifolia TaxID=103349 RepID=A0AA39AG31_VITRO|nr:hypothetical protein PVL29_002028 [Vitis rotundifolia]
MDRDQSPVATTAPTTPPSPTLLRRLINLDTTLSLHLHTLFQPVPRSLLKTLELAGDGRFFIPVAVSLLSSSSLRPILIPLLIGLLLDLLLVGVIKYIVRRPRPVYNKGMHITVAVDHWSFPSGHSSRVGFVAAFLYLSTALIGEAVAQLRSTESRFGSDDSGKAVDFIVLIVCLWSVATSISRVLLGRHFVFDVVAGACLGVLEALFVLHFLRY